MFEFTLGNDLSAAKFARRASRLPAQSMNIVMFTQANGHFEFTLGTDLSAATFA